MRAAQLAAIPALELRVISNEVEEPSRSNWRVDDGCSCSPARPDG